jgi:hypothetical protein
MFPCIAPSFLACEQDFNLQLAYSCFLFKNMLVCISHLLLPNSTATAWQPGSCRMVSRHPGIPRLVQTMGGWLHRSRETSIIMFHTSYHSCIHGGNGLDLMLGGRPSRLSKACGVYVASQPAIIQWVGSVRDMEEFTRMKVKVRGRKERQLARLVEQSLRPTRQEKTQDVPG